MHSNSIWNDLELQRKNENNVSKGCIMTVFATIWSCREKMKTRTLTHTLWHYFKQYLKLQWEKQYMFDLIKVISVNDHARKLHVKFHWIWPGYFRGKTLDAKQKTDHFVVAVIVVEGQLQYIVVVFKWLCKNDSCEVSLNLAR